MRVRSQITMQAANIGMENPGQATLGEVAEYTADLYNRQRARDDEEYQRQLVENGRRDEKWKVEQKGLALEGAAYDFQSMINKKLENNEVLTTKETHMALQYGIELPGVRGVYAEATPLSVIDAARKGNTALLKFPPPASGSGSANRLTVEEKKELAGSAYDLMHEHGYLLNPEGLTQEEVYKGVTAFLTNDEISKEVRGAVQNVIDGLGGEGNWGLLTNMFATREQAANKTRRLYDDKILLDINEHLGGNAVSKKAFAEIVKKLSATMDKKGNLLYPSTSDVDALYKKSSNRENVNGPKDAFNVAATALKFAIDVTNLTPPDIAAVHDKLRDAHREADAVGIFGGHQSDLITAAINEANIIEAGEKSRIVTKFAGLFGKSRFGIFKGMIEEHGIHYYNSTHGIFDGTGDTDEYKAFRSIMIKLSESREEGFVELYHASMMSIALSKMNDNKRAEEETNSMAPAQNASDELVRNPSKDF
jgi:hypothetical protein